MMETDAENEQPPGPGEAGAEDRLGELRQKNKALQQQVKLFSYEKILLDALLEFIPDHVYFKDVDSRFLRVSKAQSEKFGLEKSTEIVGKTDADFYPAMDALRFREQEKQLFSGQIQIENLIERQATPGHEVWWTSTTKVPFRDARGNLVGLVGISRDVTPLVRMEQELRYERDLVQTLMDHLPDSIYFKDAESRFTRVNRACAAKAGFDDPEKLVGKTDFDLFNREHAVLAFQDEKRILTDGVAVVGKEEEEIRPDGKKTWVLTTKLPLRDDTGRIIGTCGLSRDITLIKAAEAQLHQTNQMLEQQVLERTRELRQANEEMDVRIRQLDHLNRKAHDFASFIERDPLLTAVFRAFAEIVADGEAALWIAGADGFRLFECTVGLLRPETQKACLAALQSLDAQASRTVAVGRSWPKNPVLSGFFSAGGIEHPDYAFIPLVANNRLLAAVQFFTDPGFEKDFLREYGVLNTMASQAAVALDNANHYQELSEQARIQSELEIAKRIQTRLIPADPKIPNFRLKGACMPANEVGGDYLDFFQNDFGDWVAVIADVCGKGIPAALLMTSLRATMRAEARKHSSSKHLLCAVNQLMRTDFQMENSFVTCLCLILTENGASFNFCRAGHPPLIAMRRAGAGPEVLTADGIALGMVSPKQFNSLVEEKVVFLEPGDRFFAYTDGLIEGQNQVKEGYGVNRLLGVLKDAGALPLDGMVEAMLANYREFAGGIEPFDDLTFFALERE